LTRQLPNFRPSKFAVIAVGGAFCMAAAGSVSAVTLSSSSSHAGASTAAAGLTSEQVQQRAVAQTMADAAKAAATQEAAAKAAAARAAAVKAAQEHAAHVAHEKLLAARAAAAKAAAQRAAAEKAAAAKAAAQQAAAQQAAAQKTTQVQATATTTPSGSPQQIAQELLAQQGESSQFSCLDSLWERESGWNVSATNPSSGAYGIPQALPGSKMESAGSDWQTDAETQIKWGLQYIDSTYGSPCGAWSHEESAGWY
jgi:phage protein D